MKDLSYVLAGETQYNGCRSCGQKGRFRLISVIVDSSGGLFRPSAYGRENILETYSTAHAWRGIYGGSNLQSIVNPRYDQVLGPVTVPLFRVPVEF